MKDLDSFIKSQINNAWYSGTLDWKLHEGQKKIYDTVRNLPPGVREFVVLCSRRWGKSYLLIVLALENCLRKARSRERIIGPDIKQTTQIVVPLLNKIISDAPTGLIRRTKSEHKWIVGDSELILGGFDTANIESHRGSESENIWIEEGGSSNSDNYIYGMRDVLKPQLLHTKGLMGHFTTPPKLMSHEFVINTIPKAKLNNAFFTFTIFDNPILDEEQLEMAVKDCGGKHTKAFRREYLCELIKDDEILVVPEFDAKRHVMSFEIPYYAYFQTFIDFGGVRDKTVAYFVAYDFARAKKLLIDEREFGPNTPTEIITASVRQMELSHTTETVVRKVDAPGQLFVDLLASDFHVSTVQKEDWEANINQLKIAFVNNEWEVHERCKFAILTLESATFNKNKTDFDRTEALGHCDGIAALMYANRDINKRNPHPITTVKSSQFKRPDDTPKFTPPKKFGTFK